MLAVLIQIDAYDPVAAAAVTLYASSHDDPAVCHLNGQTWWPALAKLPTLRYDLFDGAFAGAITAPSSSLTLQAEPWPNLGRYMLADARLRLWTGNVGDAWGSHTLRFDGRITGQPKLVDGKASIDFAVDDRWLDQPLLATYAGTTGIEGPAGLKGQVKPLALGAPRYVAGTLVDSVNSVFQVSAYGAVQSIDTALERLARFGAPIASYASYAALVAASIPAGAWATCTASGLARFGAPPTGQVSFLIGGDAAGTDGWARKPGQLIRRLALLSGGTGKIDDTSLNALDTARPYNLSLYLDQQTTAREQIQKIAASVNAVAGVSWTGQLFVLPVAIGAPSVTLAADGSALPPIGSPQQIEIAAPYRKLALTAERAWTVHQLADIAFTATLVDVGGYSASTIYREGNIVELSDGSRYMYSAVTPTSGNSPPNATYWTPLPSAAATEWRSVQNAPQITERLYDMSYAGETDFGRDFEYPGTGYASTIAFPASTDTGGRCLDLSGAFWQFFGKDWFSYGPDETWEVKMDVEVVSGTTGALLYLGVQAVDKDGNNLGASYNYCLAPGVAQSSPTWQGRRTYVAYLRNWAAVGGQSAYGSTPAAPIGLPDGTVAGYTKAVRFRPMGLLTYPGNGALPGPSAPTGEVKVHGIRVRRLAGSLQAQDTADFATQVGGAEKPAANATRNIVTYSASAPGSPVDGDLWVDTSGTFAVFKLRSGGAWVTGANALSAYNALSGRPVALADINTTESTKLAGIATGATRNIVTYATSAPGSPVDGDLWVDTSGTYAVFKLRSGGAWVTGANALSAYNALSGTPVALADINTTESAKLAGIEASADVTPTRVTGPTTTAVAFDYTGTVKSGELPVDINFKATRADGTDVTSSTAWTATLKTGTATFTIGASTGILNVTALSANAIIEVAGTYSGKTGKTNTAVIRVLDPPPVVTGSSGGSGSAGGSASANINSSVGSSWTAVGPILTVKAGAAGEIDLTYPGSFRLTTNGTVGAYGKWQSSPAGAGTWSDVASSIHSTVDAEKAGGAEPYSDPGSISVAQNKTGLTAGSDYDFQLYLMLDDTYTANFTGTASAVAV